MYPDYFAFDTSNMKYITYTYLNLQICSYKHVNYLCRDILVTCRHAVYLCRHASYYVDLPLVSFSMHHIQYQHANPLFNMQLWKIL